MHNSINYLWTWFNFCCSLIFLNNHVLSLCLLKKHQVWVLSHCILIENNIVIEFNTTIKQMNHYSYLCNILFFCKFSNYYFVVFMHTSTWSYRTVILTYLVVIIKVCVHLRCIHYIVLLICMAIACNVVKYDFFFSVYLYKLNSLWNYIGHYQTFLNVCGFFTTFIIIVHCCNHCV